MRAFGGIADTPILHRLLYGQTLLRTRRPVRLFDSDAIVSDCRTMLRNRALHEDICATLVAGI